MPTYEYVCKSCGHLFEIVQSMRDDPLTECPECGGELRKVFAPPAISFKGSGFYATDQRRKAAAQTGEKGEKGEKGNRGDKGDKKSDSGSDSGSGESSRSSDAKKDSKGDAPAAGSKKDGSSSASGPTSSDGNRS